MEDRLDTRRLRYFMQVLDCGSVRAAAEALEMDPSAVSRAIGALERDCGTRLLERRGRGVVPTDAGELLAEYLKRDLSQRQHLLAQFDGIQKAERGHIDLIAGEGFVDWLMRHSLRSFMAEHPGITIDLDVAGTDEIVRRIVEERAHIGLVFQPPLDERLCCHHACETPIEAMVVDSHPLTRLGRPLELADLAPYRGATLHRSFGVRQHVEAAQLAEDVRLHVVLTTSSFSAVGRFVAAGLGYALTARGSLPLLNEGARVVALPLRNPLLSQGRVQVVSPRSRMLSPAAALLLLRIVADMRSTPFAGN